MPLWWIDNTPDSTTLDGIATNHFIERLRQPQTQPFFYALGLHKNPIYLLALI
jgi:hypothetical protein